jgi:hypothetical protein
LIFILKGMAKALPRFLLDEENKNIIQTTDNFAQPEPTWSKMIQLVTQPHWHLTNK